jgi:acetyltransferase-like isoleucine patch superfamily enzyme
MKNAVQKVFYTIKQKIKLSIGKKNIAKGVYIDNTSQILGWHGVKIGKNTIIGEQCWLNVNYCSKGEIAIIIGDNCFIGRRNTISSGKSVVIKDYCLTGPNVGIFDSDHIISDPMKPYVSTGATLDKSVIIGVNVWIGANAVVLAGINIGHGSIIGAGSIVNKDIPPFSIAVGNPIKVIKKYSFLQNKWLRISDWKTENNHGEGDIPEDAYLKILKEKCSKINMPPIAASSRLGDLW